MTSCLLFGRYNATGQRLWTIIARRGEESKGLYCAPARGFGLFFGAEVEDSATRRTIVCVCDISEGFEHSLAFHVMIMVNNIAVHHDIRSGTPEDERKRTN